MLCGLLLLCSRAELCLVYVSSILVVGNELYFCIVVFNFNCFMTMLCLHNSMFIYIYIHIYISDLLMSSIRPKVPYGTFCRSHEYE